MPDRRACGKGIGLMERPSIQKAARPSVQDGPLVGYGVEIDLARVRGDFTSTAGIQCRQQHQNVSARWLCNSDKRSNLETF